MHAQTTPLYFGEFRLDRESGELFRGDARVRLQEKPMQVLLLLVARAGQLVTRDDLRHHLWAADTYVDFDRNVNTAVKKLRIALGDSAEQPSYIETIPRRGYRLMVPVTTSPASHDAALVLGDVPTASHPAVSEYSAPSVSLPLGQVSVWRRTLPTGLLAVVLGVLAVSAGDARLTSAEAKTRRRCPEAVKLAVLPFQHEGRGAPHNLSVELNEGIPRKLIQSNAGYVNVLAGRSVQQYSCSKKDFRQMGRELDVRYVLEGSVRRAANGLRVTAQLFETRTGSLVAAESVDVPADEAAMAQDYVSDVVARVVLRCVAPVQRAAVQEPVRPAFAPVF